MKALRLAPRVRVLAAAAAAATAGITPVALAHNNRTAAAFLFAAATLAAAVAGCAVEFRRAAQARADHRFHADSWAEHLAATAAGRVDVNVRLLADLHAAHTSRDATRTGLTDIDATDVRRRMDGLGVDLSDPAALNAVMAFVYLHDTAYRPGRAAAAADGAPFELVASWRVDAMAARERMVHGARQLAVQAARGEIARKVSV